MTFGGRRWKSVHWKFETLTIAFSLYLAFLFVSRRITRSDRWLVWYRHEKLNFLFHIMADVCLVKRKIIYWISISTHLHKRNCFSSFIFLRSRFDSHNTTENNVKKSFSDCSSLSTHTSDTLFHYSETKLPKWHTLWWRKSVRILGFCAR